MRRKSQFSKCARVTRVRARNFSTSTANTKDGSTIYNLSVTIGISRDLLDDPNNLYNPSWSYQYDSGAETSFSFDDSNSTTYTYGTNGNMANQAWDSYTWDAKCTFDGKTVNAVTRTLHVTGLPWSDTAPGTHSSFWTLGSSCSVEGNYIKMGYSGGTGTLESQRTVTSNSFYCPADINVAFSTTVDIRSN
ncbi:MAG: hypothetical protein J5764_01985, partial [Bacteroidales bacterium]|nr:hypothetical protein [Bacteroidales bacterium]